MVRKPRTPPEAFTNYENLLYLLTELELVVESGTINWSAPSAAAVWRRLDQLTATMHLLVTRIENE